MVRDYSVEECPVRSAGLRNDSILIGTASLPVMLAEKWKFTTHLAFPPCCCCAICCPTHVHVPALLQLGFLAMHSNQLLQLPVQLLQLTGENGCFDAVPVVCYGFLSHRTGSGNGERGTGNTDKEAARSDKLASQLCCR